MITLELDKLLHLIVGAAFTILMYESTESFLLTFIGILFISISKEVIDHYTVLNHCWTFCKEQHLLDVLYSIIFFFLYHPLIYFFNRVRSVKRRNAIASSFLLVTVLNLFIYEAAFAGFHLKSEVNQECLR